MPTPPDSKKLRARIRELREGIAVAMRVREEHQQIANVARTAAGYLQQELDEVLKSITSYKPRPRKKSDAHK